MSKGVLVFAQNNKSDDYVAQACLLALSIKVIDPETNISIVTNDSVPDEYVPLFDKIIEIPWDDNAKHTEWKVNNRWKLYHITPYDETIVLDSDIIAFDKISTYWEFLDNYELFFVTQVKTYRNEIVVDNHYRKAFVENNLPNLYSGFHYFKKSDFSHVFYTWLEIVMKNWSKFYDHHVPNSQPDFLSVDVACAVVAKILDCEEKITTNSNCSPTFVHMKPKIQNWSKKINNWKEYVGIYLDDECSLKIGNFQQYGLFHYTDKSIVTDELLDKFRKKLNGKT